MTKENEERFMNVLDLQREIHDAQVKYGHFASTHEAMGVLWEEVAELIDAVRSNKRADIIKESMQVAAVAFRLADQLDMQHPDLLERSGL